MKKIPKGLKKYIRKEKMAIRKNIGNISDKKEEIEKIYKKYKLQKK